MIFIISDQQRCIQFIHWRQNHSFVCKNYTLFRTYGVICLPLQPYLISSTTEAF